MVTDRSTRERILAVASCGCLGGYLASSLGAYLGAFPGMEVAAAAAATVIGLHFEFR